MNNNTPRRRTGVLLAATIAATALLGFSRPAWAQYATGQDGHANDANNRVGSGGYNGGHGTRSGVSANDIANRDVTGLAGFRGPINSKDPRAFSGPVPGGLDNFIRESNGVPTDYGAQQTYGQTQTFYGDSRFTAPPAGSLPIGFNGGYIGTTLNTPSSLANGFNVTPLAGGLQTRTTDRDTLLLNQTINSANYTSIINDYNQAGTFNVPLNYQLGLRTTTNGVDNSLLPPALDHVAPDDMSVLRMREELRDAANPSLPLPNPKATPPNQQQPDSLNAPLNQPLNQPFDAPANATVANQVANSQFTSSQLSSTGNIATGPNARPSLVPPEMQSSLLNTLQERLARSSDVGKAMNDFRLAHQQPANVNPPTARPPGPGAEQGPIQVSSLATGVRARGLHDLLAGAEDLMRAGKYDDAIQKYNQAQRVAPNNPLTVLGRAHAELAGGYYARAEQELRTVFHNDPQLLMAQFDLGALLPKERIDFLRKDLHDLTQSDAKSERPWLLLAYLDYGTSQPASAEEDLNQADKRTVRGDWVIRLMRQHWALPSNAKSSKPSPASTTPRTIPPAPTGDPNLNK